jgi:hypothetical protein
VQSEVLTEIRGKFILNKKCKKRDKAFYEVLLSLFSTDYSGFGLFVYIV